MELQYVKALEENKLQLKDLPEDAKTGINEIKKAMSFITMLERKGKPIKPDALKRVKAMDKWVYYEILDHLEGTDKNEDEIPHDAEEVIEEQEETIPEATKEEVKETPIQEPIMDERGLKIDAELKKAYEGGKTQITLEELRSVSPTSYNVIFDSYNTEEENGISTSIYDLIETDKEVFTLTQK